MPEASPVELLDDDDDDDDESGGAPWVADPSVVASLGGNANATTWLNTASRTLFLSMVLRGEFGRM